MLGTSGLYITPTTVDYVAVERTIEEMIGNPVLVEIAKCESGLRHFVEGKVIRGTVNPKDIGLFQISETYWLDVSRELGHDIYTVEGNIAMAKYIYEENGVKPWRWSAPCHGYF